MRIYLTSAEKRYLKSLLDAQDEPEFEEYKKAKTSLCRKLREEAQ